MKGLVEALQKRIALNEFWVPMANDVTAENAWSNPDIRPCKADVDFEGWYNRLATWGEVSYFFIDKDGKKTKLERQSFTSKLTSNNFSELYNQFRVELRNIYEVDFIRRITGPDGKSYDEVLKIYVKLKTELKKNLTIWTRLFN